MPDGNDRDLMLAAAGYPVRPKPRPTENLSAIRDRMIREALDSVGGHRAKAATKLGVTVRTIYRWLARRRNVNG